MVGTLQWVGGNSQPPIQAAVSLAQGKESCVETYLKVNSLMKECLEESDRGVTIIGLPLEEMITIGAADVSWANTKGCMTQSGFVGLLRRKWMSQ